MTANRSVSEPRKAAVQSWFPVPSVPDISLLALDEGKAAPRRADGPVLRLLQRHSAQMRHIKPREDVLGALPDLDRLAVEDR